MSAAAKSASKIYESAEAALFDLGEGASVAVGGFGLVGNPEALIGAVAASGARGLTIMSNNCGNQGRGLAILLQQRQVARVVCSFVGGNPDLETQMLAGEVEVELNPQGTLAERLRAGGAGIAAFFTPTGAGTVVAEGKEVRDFGGRPHVLETALEPDYAIVRAAVGDPFGNLRFYRTSRNFNPLAAMAGRVTIAEVDELVPAGALDPDDIHLPGIFVQRLVHVPEHVNFIEYRTVRPSPSGHPKRSPHR
ncbi:Succinyl-CoA:3-ketoacid coenzyme A transferase subunit A [Enhygromyxa salina]|uniref:Succinyl-CoA:3-ketoacid coenzyme A transferase subunit A n=1 Tax=Enhygromyxa salina TaxID=215803 RepID=A0A2S9XPE9_9BACT|nr:CoA transferase subunit A [Enhygromyxa salina]PRP94744.1 Succinyl-CoA:3-ketoacid coenzyme A transferase subunit A [Enhygromyxa salina]